MDFKTASAILRGVWMIEPSYAKAQLPMVLEMLKRTSSTEKVENTKETKSSLPQKQNVAGAQSDLYSVNPWTSTDRLPYNSIAMIDIIGPITKYGGMCNYGCIEYNDLIIRLSNSERVKGILLNIDSPGGECAGTGMFAETIRQVSKVKPVLGVLQDAIAASAGYWIGSSVQELYATRLTDYVGSIGAYCTIYDYAQWFEMNGINVIEIYAPQSADKNKDYRDAVAGDDTAIKADLKFIVEDFISDVKKGRGQRLKVNGNEPFTGKMYDAKAALKLGLIDGIKPLSGVIKRMEELIALRA